MQLSSENDGSRAEIPNMLATTSTDLRQNNNVVPFPESALVRVNRDPNVLAVFFAKYIHEGWRVEPAEPSLCTSAIEHFDLTKVLLPTCTADDEVSLTLDERMRRMDENGFVPLDAYAFVALWEKRSLFPEVWKENIREWWAFHFIAGSYFYNKNNVKHLLHFRFRINDWEFSFRPADRELQPSSTMLALTRGMFMD